jgi:hypothetical protein
MLSGYLASAFLRFVLRGCGSLSKGWKRRMGERERARRANKLEKAWRSWLDLSKPDRARFVARFREAYGREREAARGEAGAYGLMVSSLDDGLTLAAEDFRGCAIYDPR